MSRLTKLTEALNGILAQIYAEEGVCPLCKSKVGTTLACNDDRHKTWCAIPKARIAMSVSK